MDETIIQVKIFTDASEEEINKWMDENDISSENLIEMKVFNTSLSLKIVVIYEIPAS